MPDELHRARARFFSTTMYRLTKVFQIKWQSPFRYKFTLTTAIRPRLEILDY